MKASSSPIPVFCYGLVSWLIAIYAAEGVQSANVGGSFSNINYEMLSELGGTSYQSVVQNGDPLRVFAAPFLHASFQHLFFNCLAVFFLGTIVERLIGASFTAGIFTISALAGEASSIMMNNPTLLSVGASGGIVGLIAALGVTSLKVRNITMRKKLSKLFYEFLIPSLLPIAGSSIDSEIDIAGHFGGAAGGAISAYLFLIIIPMKKYRLFVSYILLLFFWLFVLAGSVRIIGVPNILLHK